MNNIILKELKFCIELWEKQGGCTFGGGTKCKECASPYILLKLLTGKILHGNIERLKLIEWKKIVEDLENNIE